MKKLKWLKAAIWLPITAFLMTIQLATSADVANTNIFKNTPAIRITGNISRGDYEKVRRSAVNLVSRGNQVVVSINSEGGDYEEALRIADLLRTLNAQTFISGALSKTQNEKIEKCYSACFLIHAAGSIRHYTIDNMLFDETGTRILREVPVLGIHRPYLNPEINRTLSASQSRDRYEIIEASARKLLTAVAIPQDIIDLMFRTPSDSITLISSADFNKRIGQTQPYYQEWIRSKCGSLDKKEYDDITRIDSLRISSGNDSATPSDLSAGYVQYILNKQTGVEKCSDRSVLEHQKSVLLSAR